MRRAIAGFFALGLLFALWAGWQAWQVSRDLSESVRHAQAIQEAVEGRDPEALQSELKALRAASSAAADRTSGVTWGLLTHLPVFGDDAEGIRVTSEVLDSLAADGIEPLVTVSDRFDELLPKGGAVDLAVVKELAGPVAEAEEAFTEADARLATQEPSDYVGPLDRRFTDFRDQIGRASGALRSAEVATKILPAVLGDKKPRTYLLAFQNNAEVRGAGGLPGAVAYLRASHGKLEIVRQGSGAYGLVEKPVLPLSAAERALYGDAVGTYFVNGVMTPDIPRASQLMRAHSLRAYPDLAVDGVLFVDTVAMSYLLDATGPIRVKDVAVSGDSVVDELLHRAYLRLGRDAQDAFFAEVAVATFDRLTLGKGSPVALLRALARSADERRLLAHFLDPRLQRDIAGTDLAGEFVVDPAVTEPQIAITYNDTTASKMSYFLRTEVDVRATSCKDGVQRFEATTSLSSTAPADAGKFPASVTGGGIYGVKPGNEILTVRVFGPAGGSIEGFRFNGEPMNLVEVNQQGRPVGMTYVELAPGQKVDLSWQMTSGQGQSGDADLVVTPGIEPRDNSTTVSSACR
ncbi:MAG: DUF4012 domain-containing protein [Propionibacteriales bacterium]|nr:DUF4012 domain-containing protein [Propionibacteriales bacterium]